MKSIVSLLIAFPCLLFAQQFVDANSRLTLHELQKDMFGYPENIEMLMQRYPVSKINGKFYLTTTARTQEEFSIGELPEGFMVGSKIGPVVSLNAQLEFVQDIEELKHISYLQVDMKGSWHIQDVVEEIRADSVHRGEVCPFPVKGDSIIIGMPEIGIDYTHPIFYDSSLTNLRILASYDLEDQSGNPPSGFSSGSEYVGQAALLNQGSDLGQYFGDTHTHGTTVGGVAAGGGAGKAYFGVAPNSNMLFAGMGIPTASKAIDAISWMKQRADLQGKPLIISTSFGGMDWGPLDGTSNLCIAIDSLVDEGVVAVSSVSNDGFINFHVMNDFNNDTMLTQVDFNPYTNPDLYGAQLIMWGEAGNSFNYWIEIHDVNGLVMSSPNFNTTTAPALLDSVMINGNDTVFYKMAADGAHPANGSPYVNFKVKNTHAHYDVVLAATAASGKVHFYNLDHYTNGQPARGASLDEWNGNGYDGNSEYCIPIPACSKKTITTAGYWNSTSNNGKRDDRAPSGPTLDERMKPDVMSVSREIDMAFSSFSTYQPVVEDTILFKGKTYEMVNSSGNSYTSPAVAGIVALMLQVNSELSPAQIKEILRATAREDQFTGNLPPNGSPLWGWGKVNAAEALRAAKVLDTTIFQVEHPHSSELKPRLYPNPSDGCVFIEGLDEDESFSYQIMDLNGRLVQEDRYQHSIDISKLTSGIYHLRIQNEKSLWTYRLVKE